MVKIVGYINKIRRQILEKTLQVQSWAVGGY